MRAGLIVVNHRRLGDGRPPFTLLLAVDDATGSVVDALFCEQEDSHNYFLLMQNLLRRRLLSRFPAATLSGRNGIATIARVILDTLLSSLRGAGCP